MISIVSNIGSGSSATNNAPTSLSQKRKSKKEQLQHERIVASTAGLTSSAGFVAMVALLLCTLTMSIALGILLLGKHDRDVENFGVNEKDRMVNDYEEERALEEYENQIEANADKSSMLIPYDEPFGIIPDGEALANDVRNGKKPNVAGIVHILQMFLRDLRQSNRDLADVPSDETGLSTVRNAYFDLVQEHLMPLDKPYRGTTIFPVRTREESIFISLAAYREHLLYETLAGAFGMAKNPEKIHVGVVMQNCFGLDDESKEPYKCFTGVEVVGTGKNGRPITKVSETKPDKNGVLLFCNDAKFEKYCKAGQIRVLSVHESESLGPAIARYFASKLWSGETYFLQVDSHLQFTELWDEHYIKEIKATKNYPKSVLSMYPPGFDHAAGVTPGTRLCTCEFSQSDVEDHIIRINNGIGYKAGIDYPRPTQIAFIAAGFFFARAEFLMDVPFDPFLPWCFMGEEIALSMRAWTSGWNIYAPRKNWIAHQYRPGRMGLPKFWETVGRVFHRGIGFSNQLQGQVVHRIKYMVGYPDVTTTSLKSMKIDDVLQELEFYGLGSQRSRYAYTNLTRIDFQKRKCLHMDWCNKGELE